MRSAVVRTAWKLTALLLWSKLVELVLRLLYARTASSGAVLSRCTRGVFSRHERLREVWSSHSHTALRKCTQGLQVQVQVTGCSTTGRVGTAEIRQRYNDATPNKQLRGFFTFGRCNNCHPHDCAAALRASYAVLSAANSSPPVEPPLVDRLLCRCSVLLSGCKRFASL